jgi:hypothetical protein
MSNDPAADLAAGDEILQVMFWLRGEHLAADVAPRDLARLVTIPEENVAGVLDRLVAHGLVRPVGAPDSRTRYALTDEGVREGGRRFADEFADMTKPGHGECGDPECDCHRTGSPADCVHRAH